MERKNELCGKALDYCLAHGISDLSLRPLALQIGTSARLLIYHFGSRDGLVAAVMDEAHQRVQKSFGKLMRGGGNRDILRKFWDWTTDPRNSPYVRLLFEVQMLALQNPGVYAHHLKGTSSGWLALIETALPPSVDRRARATLCAAVIDGLLLEFLSTRDLRRTSNALDLFDSMLQAQMRSGVRSRPATRHRRLKGGSAP